MSLTSRKGFVPLILLLMFVGRQSFAQTTPAPTPPPPKVAQVEAPDTGDDVVSVELFYWLGTAHPAIRDGHASTSLFPPDLDFPGKAKGSPGAILSFPAGKYNTLRFSYFRTEGSGNTTANQNLTFFGTPYLPGDFLATNYRLQNFKVSWEYLTWKFPIEGTRFRIKTLYEAEYTTFRSDFSAPYKPITDSAGNPLLTAAGGSHSSFLPELGLGFQELVSKHFRIEAKGSGFAIPHHSTIWDAEAFMAYRHKRFEVQVGGKAFHFKTSPKGAEYMTSNEWGPYIALRYYPALFEK